MSYEIVDWPLIGLPYFQHHCYIRVARKLRSSLTCGLRLKRLVIKFQVVIIVEFSHVYSYLPLIHIGFHFNYFATEIPYYCGHLWGWLERMQLEECNDQPRRKNVFRSFKADFSRGAILRGIMFVKSANFTWGNFTKEETCWSFNQVQNVALATFQLDLPQVYVVSCNKSIFLNSIIFLTKQISFQLMSLTGSNVKWRVRFLLLYSWNLKRTPWNSTWRKIILQPLQNVDGLEST